MFTFSNEIISLYCNIAVRKRIIFNLKPYFMKYYKLTAIVLMLLLMTACGNKTSQKPTETDEQAITAVEEVVQKLFDEVWAGYDETAISKYQTADFLLLEHGEVWNNDTIINWCKSAKARSQGMQRVNTFKRIDARKNGDKLWLAYHNYGSFKQDTVTFGRAWLESVVAVKQDSVWKLELMHSTRQPVE